MNALNALPGIPVDGTMRMEFARYWQVLTGCLIGGIRCAFECGFPRGYGHRTGAGWPGI
jgi:hypothetical protein